MMVRTVLLRVLLAPAIGLALSFSAVAVAKSKPVPPPTKYKLTQVIRAETYKKMEVIQKAYEAKDYPGAIQALDQLKTREDKLNDYERATLYNLYAAVYYAQDNPKKAIEAYSLVLKQPNLAEGLRDSSLYALAQLYFIGEDYATAIQIVKKWLSVVAEPSPDGYALLAQAYYQTQQFDQAEQALKTSLRISKARGQVPKEAALALLRAIYYERKEYAKAAGVLEFLVASHPDKAAYWQQLAGMKGLLDKQRDQLNLLHAANRARLLSAETDVLNLARLYMVQNAPYPAVRLLSAGFKSKTLRINEENLQLYAQALAVSREYKLQIPVLKKLAEMSGEAKHYLYLGQTYNEVGDWTNAVAAFREGLGAKNLERPADLQMQLGTALFNAGRLAEARKSFVEASGTAGFAESAGNWIKFVDQEIARREAVQG